MRRTINISEKGRSLLLRRPPWHWYRDLVAIVQAAQVRGSSPSGWTFVFGAIAGIFETKEEV